MRIIGANGIATHGAGNIDLLLTRLEARGYEVDDVWLPMRGVFSARWSAKRDAEILMDCSKDGDVLIAHSFGCLRAAEAARHRQYKGLFLFRPAMSRRHYFDLADTEVHCWFSSGDLPIRLGSWLLLHPFGAAGIEGFSQKGVINHRSSGGHNADFYSYHLDWNLDFIDQRLRHFGRG